MAAHLAGLSLGAAISCAGGGLLFAGAVWTFERVAAGNGYDLPHAILQHGISNEWHTTAGGLIGSTPVAMGLTALASALSVETPDRAPKLNTNGLACLGTMVAVPAALLMNRGLRAVAGEQASGCSRVLCGAIPLMALGLTLALPAALLHQSASSEAALRFIVNFGAGMAGAAVREALTQTSAPAWSGIERNGQGWAYGLSEARGHDRLGSTLVPTLASCLFFAGSTALMHQLEARLDLGMVPAGSTLLTLPAAEVGRRTALKSLLLQSTNELLEGIWRGLPLAAYAGARGIKLRYRNAHAGLADVPAALRATARDPAAWDKASVFASVRAMDGALPNLFSQLAGMAPEGPFWNGFRVAAVLAQGATMSRTPLLAAHALPRLASAGAAVGTPPAEAAAMDADDRDGLDAAASSSVRISTASGSSSEPVAAPTAPHSSLRWSMASSAGASPPDSSEISIDLKAPDPSRQGKAIPTTPASAPGLAWA